jgi:hypothetical protein
MYKGYIYRHWHLEKSYIGQTYMETPEQRWQNGRGYSSAKFARAIKKYGWDNFGHETLLVIECETKEELVFWLNQWEIYYIEKFDSFNNGYNATTGGDNYICNEECFDDMRQSVVCLNTKQIFKSLSDAMDWLRCDGDDIPAGSIGIVSLCCSGKLKRAMQHPLTGEKLAWAYYKDYVKMTQEEINKKVTIATKDVFNSAVYMDLQNFEDKNVYKNSYEFSFETLDALNHALGFLTDVQLYIFKQVVLEGKTQEQVANEIGRKKSSVNRTYKEAISKIQQRFTVEQFKEILY